MRTDIARVEPGRSNENHPQQLRFLRDIFHVHRNFRQSDPELRIDALSQVLEAHGIPHARRIARDVAQGCPPSGGQNVFRRRLQTTLFAPLAAAAHMDTAESAMRHLQNTRGLTREHAAFIVDGAFIERRRRHEGNFVPVRLSEALPPHLSDHAPARDYELQATEDYNASCDAMLNADLRRGTSGHCPPGAAEDAFPNLNVLRQLNPVQIARHLIGFFSRQ